MRGVEITTVVGCGLDCTFCPQHILRARYKGDKYMSLNMFGALLANIPKDVVISFCGFAEPWSNSLATKFLRMADDMGHETRVYTTMMMGMTKGDLLEIFKLRPSEFHLHLPDQNLNMVARYTADYFDMLEMLKLEAMANPDFHARIRIELHGPALEEHFWWTQEFPTRYDLQNRAGNLPMGRGPAFVHGNLRCNVVPEEREVWPDWPVLLPNGDLILCCQDYGLEHVLGNLIESTYDEIIHGPVAENIRQALINEKIPSLCRKCAYAKEVV